MLFHNLLNSLRTIELNKYKTLERIKKSRFANRFSRLDLPTLERWSSGRTSPSLYKQLMISISLTGSYDKLLECYQGQQLSDNKDNKLTIDKLVTCINSNRNYLPYFKLNQQRVIEYCICDNQSELDRILPHFFHNIDAMGQLFTRANKQNLFEDHHTMLCIENENLVGHICFIKDTAPYLRLLSINSDNINGQMCILPMNYSDSDVLIMLVRSFYRNKAVQDYLSIRSDAIILLNNHKIFWFFEKLADGIILKHIKSTTPKMASDSGVYVIRVNLLKLLGNPTVFNIVNR